MAKPSCTVSGCEREQWARGYCGMHYQRWRKTGKVERLSVEQRFWSKVDRRSAAECWLWHGAVTSTGYGDFIHGRPSSPGAFRMKAHRFAYELLVGLVPERLVLDHLCRTPLCVNPAHLEPVTQRENVLRGVAPTAINARKTHCTHGHEFTTENTRQDARGRRVCRTCHRRGVKDAKRRKREARKLK